MYGRGMSQKPSELAQKNDNSNIESSGKYEENSALGAGIDHVASGLTAKVNSDFNDGSKDSLSSAENLRNNHANKKNEDFTSMLRGAMSDFRRIKSEVNKRRYARSKSQKKADKIAKNSKYKRKKFKI